MCMEVVDDGLELFILINNILLWCTNNRTKVFCLLLVLCDAWFILKQLEFIFK